MADTSEKTLPLPGAEPRFRQASGKQKGWFSLILLLGLLARLAYLGGESVWWDEFATVAFLQPPPAYENSPQFERWNQQVIRESSPTLRAFLHQNKDLDPAAMPLYLAVEYYWNRYVHASPLALRVLSVLFGLAVLPALYLLGKFLFGPGVGLIAMFCAALSPIHVQFSKEIRMYGLFTLLAVIVVYAFCRMLEDPKRRWWIVYAVAVALLSWTHPFALLLPPALGLFWLVTRPGEITRWFKWGLLTAAVTLPAAIWVITIQFWGQDSTASWMRAPTLVELVNDIFADDAIGATYQVNATSGAWAWIVGDEAAQWIISRRWTVGRATVAGAVVAIVWLLAASTVFRRWASLSGPGETSAARRRSAVLTLLWTVLPPLILYGLSVAWRPCHQPRYTVHSSLGLYLLVGGAIMALPKRAFRIAGVVCLVAFYGYQQMLMLGAPQHPDYIGVSKLIREEARPHDLILSHNWLWKRVFAYTLGPVPNIVCYGSTYAILAEKTAFSLDPETPAGPAPRNVWVVVQTDYFTEGTIAPLEQEFTARGLGWSAHEFSGIQRVLLYRVWQREDTPPYQPAAEPDSAAPKEFSDLAMEYWRTHNFDMAVATAQNAIRIHPEYARAWSYLGMSYKEQGRNAEALEAFERAMAIDPGDYPWTLNNHAELLILAGRHEEAVTISRKALEALPGDPWCLALLGRAYYYLGDYQQAHTALTEAAGKESQDMRIRLWLEEAKKALSEAVTHE